MSEPTEPSHSRRRILQALAATGGLSALAGCGDINPLNTGPISLPPFTEGWAEIQENGDAEVVLQFDGDIVSQITSLPIPVSELMSLAIDYDGDISRESVDIRGTENLPDSEIAEGVFEDAATVDSWPGASFYELPRAFIPEEMTFSQTGQDFTIELPVNDPTLHVIFPSGYEYTLPDMHDDVSRQPMIEVQRESGGLMHYGENPKDRTLPEILHYDHSDMVWMRAASEYRAKWLRNMAPLYDTQYYIDNQFSQIQDAAQSISEKLAENALESVLTSPLPTAATAPLDLKDINDTVTDDYSEFSQALESISAVANMLTENHRKWMNPLIQEEKGQDLVALGRLARNEYRVVNPLLVSSPDQNLFESNLSTYRSLLEEQESILTRIRVSSDFSTWRPSDTDEPYWRNLYKLADNFLQQADNMIGEELAVIDSIESGFS